MTYEKWVLKLHNKLNKKWCNKLLERKKRTGKTGQLCRLIARCVLPSFLMKCAEFRRCLVSNSAHLKIDSNLLLHKTIFLSVVCLIGWNNYSRELLPCSVRAKHILSLINLPERKFQLSLKPGWSCGKHFALLTQRSAVQAPSLVTSNCYHC